MVLGSHNAWSYLKPKKWWMWPFVFTAKCQKYDIRTQYDKYNSRCFDLRVSFNEDGEVNVVHNLMQYKINPSSLNDDLQWLNDKGDVYIRLLLDVRFKKNYTQQQRDMFKAYCEQLVNKFPQLTFICGRNLYNWEVEYDFGNNVSIEELYSSVQPPKIIDDWWPWIYAKLHNKENIANNTDRDVLLVDFVNIQ